MVILVHLNTLIIYARTTTRQRQTVTAITVKAITLRKQQRLMTKNKHEQKQLEPAHC